MTKADAIAALGALAQESRLDIFRLLVQAGPDGLPAGQIGERLGVPPATLSFHLNTLKQAGLIQFRRESRSLIYSASFDTMNALLAYLTENCCAGGQEACAVPCCDTAAEEKRPPGGNTMSENTVYNVLFICTGNSARSQMADGLLRHDGGDAYEVHSAGTRPGQVNPLAIAAMRELGIDISGHRSKSVDEFAGQAFDYVITVCDNAKESCPVFPGRAECIHWSFEDPAAAPGDEAARLAVFRRVRDEIRERLRGFLAGQRP